MTPDMEKKEEIKVNMLNWINCHSILNIFKCQLWILTIVVSLENYCHKDQEMYRNFTSESNYLLDLDRDPDRFFAVSQSRLTDQKLAFSMFLKIQASD